MLPSTPSARTPDSGRTRRPAASARAALPGLRTVRRPRHAVRPLLLPLAPAQAPEPVRVLPALPQPVISLVRFRVPQARWRRLPTARPRRRRAVRAWLALLPGRVPALRLPGRAADSAARATLERAPANPILAPRAGLAWESQAVFNAAALELGGRVHLLYRAVGADGQSVLGLAVSGNGIDIDERPPAPVYALGESEMPVGGTQRAPEAAGYHSGAVGPGCEDPRLTLLDGRVWLSYTEFDGAHAPRMALSSIAVDDFLARRWRWRPPVHLSAPGQAHKNWVLFPQRIGGHVALLHGIAPAPRLVWLDGLDLVEGDFIASGYCNDGDPQAWDNLPRGAGPPPIATADGWLLLYHAMDRRDPGRYKLGAMLLERHDPRRVLARLPYPLLEPDARCENEGHKAGVVYCCGALVRGGTLWVYYGGADSVVCVASVALGRLLAALRPPLAERGGRHARLAA